MPKLISFTQVISPEQRQELIICVTGEQLRQSVTRMSHYHLREQTPEAANASPAGSNKVIPKAITPDTQEDRQNCKDLAYKGHYITLNWIMHVNYFIVGVKRH